MNIGAIIPARYYSSRFPGKPLVKISGVSMIERVYRQVQKSERFKKIIVATDDLRIANEVKRFGGSALITSKNCTTGTERVWEVLKESDIDSVINIQGDEPLISELLISAVYDRLSTGKDSVVTAAFFNKSYEEYKSINIVKSVFDKNGKANYFSRSPIPYCDSSEFKGFYQHVGIYGYVRNALSLFVGFSPSQIELEERLEQLRFLDNGIDIHVLKTEYKSVGVDIPNDVYKIEKIIGE